MEKHDEKKYIVNIRIFNLGKIKKKVCKNIKNI